MFLMRKLQEHILLNSKAGAAVAAKSVSLQIFVFPSACVLVEHRPFQQSRPCCCSTVIATPSVIREIFNFFPPFGRQGSVRMPNQ